MLGIRLLKTDKRKHCNQNVNGIVIAPHEVIKLSFIVQSHFMMNEGKTIKMS